MLICRIVEVIYALPFEQTVLKFEIVIPTLADLSQKAIGVERA
jgi:hypothetical protein